MGATDSNVRNNLARYTILVSALYVLTRGSHLARELGYEESIFAMPGLNLFSGNGFFWSWGELVPRANPFHKPPLLSLLVGSFAQIAPEPGIGAKLVPFLCGWLTALIPLWLTSRIIPSLLLLVSPFFFAAAGHIQTDPTVGLVGYGLACWGLWKWYSAPNAPPRAGTPLLCGLIVLWLGKVETAIIVSAAIAPMALFDAYKGRHRLLVLLGTGSVAGLVLLVLAVGLLASSAGFTLREALAELFGTITGMTDRTFQSTRRLETHIALARQLSLLGNYQVTTLFLVFLIPILGLYRCRRTTIEVRLVVALAIAALLPGIAYLTVGYQGDGNPRYYLVCFVPLAILAGLGLRAMSEWYARAAATTTILLALYFMGPATFALMLNSGNPASVHHESGYRQAAFVTQALTRSGSLVILPEPSVFYTRDRRAFVFDSFHPYPNRHSDMLNRLPQIDAVALPRDMVDGRDPLCLSIVTALRGEPHVEVLAGSFLIIARTGSIKTEHH